MNIYKFELRFANGQRPMAICQFIRRRQGASIPIFRKIISISERLPNWNPASD
jgi:hypothetical protein